jgi:hypothetical protein
MFANLAMRNSSLMTVATRAFRTSAVTCAAKKPSIGDAVTILQSKVSGINQVVSTLLPVCAKIEVFIILPTTPPY